MNSPAEVAKNYINIGKGKVNTPIAKMFILGIMAGMFIAWAGLASTVAGSTIENASVAKFVNAALFPGGLAMVLVAGSELFTGNCLLIIPLMEKAVNFAGVLKNWVVVWCGNLVGALFVSAISVGSHQAGLFSNRLVVAQMSTAISKCSLSFSDAFLKGLACNILVCIAVWMSFAAKDVAGKILGLYFPILFFVVCGFEHSVANMYYTSVGVLAKGNATYLQAATDAGLDVTNLTWGHMFANNLIPVTLGNLVGGLLVGLVYWFCYLQGKKES